MLRSLLCCAGLLLALIFCPALHAEALVHLSVVDRDTGQPLAELPHRDQRWIEGAPGHRYALRLANLSGQRVLMVVSVDGVNALTGQTAQPRQGGYVLGPWQSTEITGWRKSLQDVAQFVFTDLGDSYAARTGRPHNLGVIGVAVFLEQAPVAVAPAPMDVPADRTSAAPSPIPAESVQQLGTGHGTREWAPVTGTEFTRASDQPQQLTQLRYDTRRRLVALGIVPRERPDWQAGTPQAFPGRFVPDP